VNEVGVGCDEIQHREHREVGREKLFKLAAVQDPRFESLHEKFVFGLEVAIERARPRRKAGGLLDLGDRSARVPLLTKQAQRLSEDAVSRRLSHVNSDVSNYLLTSKSTGINGLSKCTPGGTRSADGATRATAEPSNPNCAHYSPRRESKVQR